MNLGPTLSGNGSMPLPQMTAIARLEANQGAVRPPEIGKAPAIESVPAPVAIQFRLWDNPPPAHTHIPTSRLAIAKTPHGTFIVQQFEGRTRSHPTIWAKLPVFDLMPNEPAPPANDNDIPTSAG